MKTLIRRIFIFPFTLIGYPLVLLISWSLYDWETAKDFANEMLLTSWHGGDYEDTNFGL